MLSKIPFTCFDWEMTFIFMKICVLSKQIPFVKYLEMFFSWCVGCVCIKYAQLLGEAHRLKPTPLARHHSSYLQELFTTGGPGKEHRAN